jgi:hypothetical protein
VPVPARPGGDAMRVALAMLIGSMVIFAIALVWSRMYNERGDRD